MSNDKINRGRPPCFADLNRVFPMGEDGLRTVSPACDPCGLARECLGAACHSPEGLELRAERMSALDRNSRGGLRSFFKRWSELKNMKREAIARENPSRNRK